MAHAFMSQDKELTVNVYGARARNMEESIQWDQVDLSVEIHNGKERMTPHTRVTAERRETSCGRISYSLGVRRRNTRRRGKMEHMCMLLCAKYFGRALELQPSIMASRYHGLLLFPYVVIIIMIISTRIPSLPGAEFSPTLSINPTACMVQLTNVEETFEKLSICSDF